MPEEDEDLRGPHGWLNWKAQQLGQPRRTEAHPDAVVISPIWQEFALYSDAPLHGGWIARGPFEFILVDPVGPARLGVSRKVMVLRTWDHLLDAPPDRERAPLADDVMTYIGGDQGDELAALLGLALDRRFRSGGSVRIGLPNDSYPLGLISEAEHHPPSLDGPRRSPMIDWLGESAHLENASRWLELYPQLEAGDAVALVRAARQYGDALWLADADPRVAWSKLIGALEVAANAFDDARDEAPVAQLKRHRRRLFNALRDDEKKLEAVACELSRTFNVERKVSTFVERFDPGPPSGRPNEGWQFPWEQLDEALAVIYDHRSRDLHDGIPFPFALCEPPYRPSDGAPSERFFALGMSGKGGQWSGASLPLYLHIFAHMVGGALRNWWAWAATGRQV